ncbi:hypothetical protein NLU13_1050 [Sarocladium strictum]|uniref:Uncharacterized protein n=1 Tax=Sarocladium strictum TaxID=5046 RepID=A0AA39LC03_SARSR|nr:hypothetical protein NLU13_1050 [Sarocladium strictum]
MAVWMILSFLALSLAVQGQAGTTLSSKGCADPSGLEKCQASANDQTSSCIAQANKDNSQRELLACTCVDYVSNYNCFASHCWNRVWECEYQDYMVGYFQNCLTAKTPVPYFPAPDNVPDACSCNLGRVYAALHDAIQESTTCSNNANSGDAGSDLQRMEGCNCCAVGGSIAALVGICPDTDPTLIGLNGVSQFEKNVDVDYQNCGTYLQEFNCANDLGFQLDGVTTYIGPNDPIQTGTDTLSNGGGTVTSPASGAVFTYTNGGDGQVYTITAAGFDGKESKGSSRSGSSNDGDSNGNSNNNDNSGSGSGSESGSGSGSGSGSTSQTASASASATGDGKKEDHKGGAGSLAMNMSTGALVALVTLALVCLTL